MAKTRMLAFRIAEISAVDSPAQKGAVVSIMKRDADLPLPTPAKGEGERDFVKRFSEVMRLRVPNKHKRESIAKAVFVSVAKGAALTQEVDGHTHIIVTDWGSGELRHGETTWVGGHSHPWIRDVSGIIIVGAANGHTHDVGVMTTKDAGFKEPTMPDKKTTTTVTQEAFDALQKRADRADAILALSEAHRTHFYTLEGDAQGVFLAKSDEARSAEIEAGKAEDPVVFKSDDGTEFRKSDDPRLVSMAKSRDEDRRSLIAANAARATVEFEKRAGTEIPHLPGEVGVKVALLKAIDTLDTDVREKVLTMVKANDAALAAAFARSGTTLPMPAGANDAEAEIERLAKAHAEKHNVPFVKAYDAVLNTAEGQRLYAKAVDA